jgi:hypothetical protein
MMIVELHGYDAGASGPQRMLDYDARTKPAIREKQMKRTR